MGSNSWQNSRREFPDIAGETKLIMKHAERRKHAIIIRKCIGKRLCTTCKTNPPKSSKKLLSSLPTIDEGGLFWAPTPSETFKGHNLSYLEVRERRPTVIADRDIGVDRCAEPLCFYTFTSKVDKDKHFRVTHQRQTSVKGRRMKERGQKTA